MVIPRTPSVWRIIRTDFYATEAAIFLFFFLALMVVFLGIPLLLDSSRELLVMLVCMGFWVVVGVGVLALRVSIIRSAFNDGQELKGQITGVLFTRNYGRVSYSYVYMGTPYKASNRIMKNGRTRRLEAGSAAMVMVDTGDPRRAFLRDIYV